MTDTIKIPLLTREADPCALEMRAEGGGFSFSLSSETPVERVFGDEVLVHDSKSIRLARVNQRAMPLLFNHNWDDPIGMVDSASVRDGRMVVDAHFFDTERAKDVAAMVRGGLKNVSVGYRIYDAEEDSKSGQVRVTDWEPYEASIVTVPADPSVGIGRSSGHEFEFQIRSNSAADAAGVASMSNQDNAAASASADQVIVTSAGPSARDIETARVRGIENIAKANNIGEDQKRQWITGGASFEQVADDLLSIVGERSKYNKSASEVGLTAKEASRFSVLAAVRAVADKDWSKAGMELEASRAIAQKLGVVPDPNKFYVPMEVQKRDLTVGTTTAGGFLVETANQSFIELMRNRSVIYNMGATRLSGLTGNVTVPRHTAAATAYWLANEGTAITESQQTFAQMTLSPKNVGAYTEISRQLLLQSSPDAEGLVTSDLATVVALAVDQAGISGSGASGQPQGIIGTSGVGSVTGTSIAYAGIIEFQTDVAAGNLLAPSCGYVTTPTVAGLLKQRVKFSSTASPLWEGNVLDGTVDGFRAMSSLQMPTANILFGDFSKVVVAEWGVLQVEVNPYANFQAGIIGVRAIYSVDIGVRYGAAFSLATSVT